MQERVVVARLSLAAQKREKGVLFWTCVMIAAPPLTLWGVVASFEPIILAVGAFLSMFLIVRPKAVLENLRVGIAQWRSGWIAIWIEGEKLHLGFRPKDVVPLNIRSVRYSYLRNGTESFGSVSLSEDANRAVGQGYEYDRSLHHIFKCIAEIAGLERQPDREYRYQGRWTEVTWGRPGTPPEGSKVLVGHERP